MPEEPAILTNFDLDDVADYLDEYAQVTVKITPREDQTLYRAAEVLGDELKKRLRVKVRFEAVSLRNCVYRFILVD